LHSLIANGTGFAGGMDMKKTSDPLRVAIIGAGRIGCRRAAVISASRDARVVAVADTDLARAAALASACSCPALSNWEAAAVARDVDAVVVATTHDWLARVSLTALEAGKHVLCEKPMARHPAEAAPVVAAAEQRGLVLAAGFNHRCHPAIRRARELAAAGAIGCLLWARCRYGHGGRAGYEREWRSNRERAGGGELLDQGIHALDLFAWLFGEFVEVAAFLQTAFWPAEVEDNAFVWLRTAAGQVASLHASWTQWRNLFSLELCGSEGYLTAEGLGGSYGAERLTIGRRASDFGPPSEQVIEFTGGDSSWADEWEAFVRAVHQGTPPTATGRDAMAALRLAEAAYRAAARREPVTLGGTGATVSVARVLAGD
jgi:predicted dehydrogenase